MSGPKQGSASDWRPRCESCRQPILGIAFRIRWTDEVFFDVCEACSPLPEDRFTVQAWSVIAEKEKEMEQSD
jgi:hypothetical protein